MVLDVDEVSGDGSVPEFNLETWKERFSLDDYELYGVSLNGPDGICTADLIRQEAGSDLACAFPIPCDVYVMAYGPSPRQDITLLGNVPYRPASVPWPVSQTTGRNLTFICQFRVTESKDILGELPGDIVLMFAETPNWGDADPPIFEWWPLDIPEEDLIEAKNMPVAAFDVPPCYGFRCRYSDLLNEHFLDLALDVIGQLPRVKLDGEFDPANERIRGYVRGWVWQIGMIKVGGVPTIEHRMKVIHEDLCCGKFIAQVPSVLADASYRYTWLNCETEKDFDRFPESSSLIWPDEVIVGIFIDSNGQTVARCLP